MNKTLIISALALGAWLGQTAALAAEDANAVGTSTRVFVRDSAITASVKTKLAAEHLSSVARIHVDTDRDGVVWLSGTASSQEAIEKAIEIARGTDHVRSVHSDVTVRSAD